MVELPSDEQLQEVVTVKCYIYIYTRHSKDPLSWRNLHTHTFSEYGDLPELALRQRDFLEAFLHEASHFLEAPL